MNDLFTDTDFPRKAVDPTTGIKYTMPEIEKMKESTDTFFKSVIRPETLYRPSDPESSEIAANKAVKTGLVKTHEQRLLYWVGKYPGVTTKDIEAMSYGTEYQISHTQAGKGLKDQKRRGFCGQMKA